MRVYYSDDAVSLYCGDCREVLATLPDGSAQTCVTSPPYFGLRDYGHEAQIGLERTPDEYVAALVSVFREVRRVLADNGTLWLNLGDTFAASRGGTPMPAETLAGGVSGRGDARAQRGRDSGYQPHRDPAAHGLKHKDLMGIPWRVAFALQADGWWLRSDIIWHKPNPMPESVTDRPTKAHEYLFLLAKSERYYYDADAIKETATWDRENNPAWAEQRAATNKRKHETNTNAARNGFTGWQTSDGRNKRSVWTVATRPYKGAHFATFPPDLIRPCILAGAPAGGVVLDPFGGSGTTGAVAKEAGRRAVLIEASADYCALAVQRWPQHELFTATSTATSAHQEGADDAA